MAKYRAENFPDQNCIIDKDQTYQSSYQGIVKLLDGQQWSARESNMGLLEIYQFEARTGEPVRDLKGGACRLHLESGAYCSSAIPSPLKFASNCQCQCSYSPCPPPPCPPSPPCYPCPPPPCPPSPPCYPCPQPVESCSPGLHQKYRDFYTDCKETHLPSGYRNFVEHDDLYLPPRNLSSASNYCNRPTSSKSWLPPSPSPQLKCHCGAAQYQSAQLRSGSTWETLESKPCIETFFQASPSPRGSPPKHPSRCESLYLVETPKQGSPKHPHSKPTSPVQPRSEVKTVMNISCQCSPKPDSRPKSFQTQKSGASSPLSPYNLALSPNLSPRSRRKRPSPSSPTSNPSKPIGFPEPSTRPLNRTPHAAELVTAEKHVRPNCSPKPEPAEFDKSYTRRPSLNPSLYDSGASNRRVLLPESPVDLARNSRRLECTCQQHKPAGKKSYNQLYFLNQNGSRSKSPVRSSISAVQHGTEEADLNITTFLDEVKRILTADVPPRFSPTVRKQDLKQDYNSSARSTLKPEVSSRELYPSAGRSKDRKTMLSSSARTTDWQEENLPSTEYLSRVRSSLKPAVPTIDFTSSARTNRKQDSTARDNFPFSGRTPDWQQEFSSSGRTPDWQQEFPSSGRTDRKQDREIPSSGRTDRKQAERKLSSKQGLEFPSDARTKDRKQWDFPSNLNWEFPLTATDRKQEYSTCVRMTERGSSPIIVTPVLKDSGPTSARTGIESAARPKTAPNVINSEAPGNSRPLQNANGHHDAAQRSSTRTAQSNISPPTKSEGDYRYGPVQPVIPKAAEPPKLNFNKRDSTLSRLPKEVIRRCCCGTCKSPCSRSHFTTKCPFCATVHSCCCGMCSCPFPTCSSKCPILDSSNTSNYTSTTTSPSNDKPPFHNNYSGFSSRPKSVSPKRTYLAGLDKSYRQRSKSSRSRCKLQQRAFEPSPRALLESFHNYLKSESRRAKESSSPHRRSSDRRSAHWNYVSPDRNCSQRAKRLSKRKAPRGPQQQHAPWGTHPILLSSGPPNLEYRLPYSVSHRGCCCPRCINGKL